MINDFLKKYQEELLSDKIQLKEDMDLLEIKIKEENKFLNLLEESNESYFKEFTPRDLNAKNNAKAEEIKQTLIELNSSLDDMSNKMSFYDGRLSEINLLLSDIVVDNKPDSIPNDNDKNIEKSSSDSLDVESISNSELIAGLLNIKDLILLDPYRAQIELEKIISSI